MLSGYNPDVEVALPHPSSQLTVGRRGEVQRRDAGKSSMSRSELLVLQKRWVETWRVRLMELGQDRLFPAPLTNKNK